VGEELIEWPQQIGLLTLGDLLRQRSRPGALAEPGSAV